MGGEAGQDSCGYETPYKTFFFLEPEHLVCINDVKNVGLIDLINLKKSGCVIS